MVKESKKQPTGGLKFAKFFQSLKRKNPQEIEAALTTNGVSMNNYQLQKVKDLILSRTRHG